MTYPIFENEFDLDSSDWGNQATSSSDAILKLIQYGYLEFYHGNLILTNSFNPWVTLYFTIDLQDFLSLN